jgi:hypothetical protein
MALRDDETGGVLLLVPLAAAPLDDVALLFLLLKNLERKAELDLDTPEVTVDSSWESSETESDMELPPPEFFAFLNLPIVNKKSYFFTSDGGRRSAANGYEAVSSGGR